MTSIEHITPHPHEQPFVQSLIRSGQEHLFAHWAPDTNQREEQATFLQTLRRLDEAYPGGLTAYIENARRLLGEAKIGANPYAGYVPHQPDTVDLTQFNEEYDRYEALGKAHFDKTAVVLVAGGLGERLGYHGIKLDIPVEVTEHTSYLAHYAACLKAMEQRMERPRPVPFIIMVSEDTQAATQAALETHAYFGLRKEQVHILKQELVPAIADNEGRLALAAPYRLVLKPHGHGDVHMLLHTSGLARKLEQEGIQHFLFIQDTNGQVFNAVPAALGVSVDRGFTFNSVAVNRIPGEAVGGLAKLVGNGHEMTVNVEYNQLDPLLRATVSPEGDVPNAHGFSLFPGNINVLVIEASAYVRLLEATKGIIAEFVNPKYADASKTSFKKPTRLETMMQDLAKLLAPEQKVGVSIFARSWCFSANKNNIVDAAAKHAAGGPPESGATAESDFYGAGRAKLEAAGMRVECTPEILVRGVPVVTGPRVILRPSFAMTLAEVRHAIRGGSIEGNATLILEGSGVRLENVTIKDGATLTIKATSHVEVVCPPTCVENKGHQLVPLSDEEQARTDTPEYLRIRGYRIVSGDA